MLTSIAVSMAARAGARLASRLGFQVAKDTLGVKTVLALTVRRFKCVNAGCEAVAEGGIRQAPDVPAMHAGRGPSVVRAGPFHRANPGMQRDRIHRPLDDLNDNPGQVREKIINTLRT
jgi:hypothetical protein